jgi:S-DNA-T family DNA segregation ATPase FtsK/SpoIIIE
LFYEAAKLVVEKGSGSPSDIMLNFKIGYHRSGKIIDQLEAAGIVDRFEGSKARQVIITDLVALDRHLEGENFIETYGKDLDVLIENQKK